MPWELNEAAFRAPAQAAALVRAIRAHTDPARPLRLMEICGTHTMAARFVSRRPAPSTRRCS